MVRRSFGWLLLAAGCGAPSAPEGGGASLEPSRCGRGAVAVHSDYQSTSVSILAVDGSVAQPLLVSSASEDVGLSAPLSGDVIAPTGPLEGDEVVLIDRYPAAVISWVGLDRGRVRAQLDLRTGFASNPQDYLRIDATTALVTRYGEDPEPGTDPFDGGNDVLVIDPSSPEIRERIDLAGLVPSEVLPRPSRMVDLGDRIAVLLSAFDDTFDNAAPSRLALLDRASRSVEDVVVLDGLLGCSALARHPDEARVAVGCAGRWGGDSEPDLSSAGVVVLDTTSLAEVRRWSGASLGRPPGFSLAFDGRGSLWTSLFGSLLDEPIEDRAVTLSLGDGTVIERLTAEPFTLGEVRCAARVRAEGGDAGCGSCWLTDADAGVVHRFGPTHTTIEVDDGVGLPPRYLGWLE